MSWNKNAVSDDELLINTPALLRANWAAIELGTDAALKITNAKVAAAAGIVDTKLATISTAGKVNGAALTGLASVPAGAGNLPEANLGNAVKGPGSNTDGYIPLWDGADSKTLKAGVELDTDGGLTANSDTKVASQKAVKTAVDTKEDSLGYTPENVSNKKTSLGSSDTYYPSQKAVQTAIDAIDTTPSASSVGQSELKTATGEVNVSSVCDLDGDSQMIAVIAGNLDIENGQVELTDVGNSYVTKITLGVKAYGKTPSDSVLTLPGGSYGFYPQVKNLDETSYTVYTYAQQRYVTASGHDHWIFLLVDKETGKPISSYQAPDHPSANQGDATELDIPHPFGSYDPEKHEIVVVDNSDLQTMIQKKKQRRANGERGVSLLQVINENYLIDDTKRPKYNPREIVKIDEEGLIKGETIKTMKTPDWAKILVTSDEISLKRRMVEKLPNDILFKKMALKK
jgi:hypothetical protein